VSDLLNANRHVFLIVLWADVHGNSRLQRELKTNDAFFGGIARLESTIHVSDNKNMATKKGSVIIASVVLVQPSHCCWHRLRAILAGLTPVFKLDESANCASFDGLTGGSVTTLTACDSAPYNTSALHCRCLAETSSPNQVVVSAVRSHRGLES
jgi:hypothetical protein